MSKAKENICIFCPTYDITEIILKTKSTNQKASVEIDEKIFYNILPTLSHPNGLSNNPPIAYVSKTLFYTYCVFTNLQKGVS